MSDVPSRKRLRAKTLSAEACRAYDDAAVFDEPVCDVVMPVVESDHEDVGGVIMPVLESDDDFCKDADSQDDEAAVSVSDALLSCLKLETTLETTSVIAASLASSSSKASERIACPLCPFRCFASGVSALRHLEQCHTEINSFVCSGQKQRRVVVALYDNDMLAGRVPADLLARSASILRSSIVPPLLTTRTSIDRDIRLVLTAGGPVYANAASLGSTMSVRRVGNLHYSRCFANLLLRELTMAKGRLSEALTRVHLHACSAGSELSNLFPQHGMSMWSVAQDIFFLDPVRELFAEVYSQLLAHYEFETLTMDATVKVCLAIMGQASGANIRKNADAAAMPEEAHLRRLVTVRGRSGSVLALRLVREEAGLDIAAQLKEWFSSEQLAQVKFIGVDQPSRAWHVAFKQVCPALEFLYEDVVHLALNCEKGFGGKRSQGSIALRKILTKFDSVDPQLSCTTWSDEPFVGQGAVPLAQAEHKWRAIIGGGGGLTREQALAFLSALGSHRPFISREEFIRAVACLSVVFGTSMDRRGSNKNTVRSFLFNATSSTQCAWYFNNHIHRHSIQPAGLNLLASDTTGNEALHNELKQAFRQTIRLHQSTMVTKMRVFLFGKLLSFKLARFRPTGRQMRPAQILARALASDFFEEDAWTRICGRRAQGKALHKSSNPLLRWRHLDVARMRRWLRKKPGIPKRRVRPMKRTVFTLQRLASRSNASSGLIQRSDGRARKLGSSSAGPAP